MRYHKNLTPIDLLCKANADEDGHAEVTSPFTGFVIACDVDFDTGDYVFTENGVNVSQDYVQYKFETWDERLASAGKMLAYHIQARRGEGRIEQTSRYCG
jgi:hypothetical protein